MKTLLFQQETNMIIKQILQHIGKIFIVTPRIVKNSILHTCVHIVHVSVLIPVPTVQQITYLTVHTHTHVDA